MNELIKQDETMITNYKLSKTVKGVGMVLAVQMLLHTHNYTRFESSDSSQPIAVWYLIRINQGQASMDAIKPTQLVIER